MWAKNILIMILVFSTQAKAGELILVPSEQDVLRQPMRGDVGTFHFTRTSWEDIKATADSKDNVDFLEHRIKVQSYAEITQGYVDESRYLVLGTYYYDKTGDINGAMKYIDQLRAQDSKHLGKQKSLI